jgi:hypothetical protein
MQVFRQFKAHLRLRRARNDIFARKVSPRPHGLSAPLLVSLTSYARRFATLHLTLRGLLLQDMRADAVILWVDAGDFRHIPDAVLALRDLGLSIRTTENLRSYKKLIPLLAERPEAFIVTADDDLYYPANWLSDLVETARRHPGEVIGHRCHRIRRGADGQILSYEEWQKNIGGSLAGADIFATGAGGVLYPPGVLHADTTRKDLFQLLAPTADDVWFYWMARRQGSLIRHVGPKTRILEWPGSQLENLRSLNLRPAQPGPSGKAAGAGQQGPSGNDAAIAAMLAHFGPPDQQIFPE